MGCTCNIFFVEGAAGKGGEAVSFVFSVASAKKGGGFKRGTVMLIETVGEDTMIFSLLAAGWLKFIDTIVLTSKSSRLGVYLLLETTASNFRKLGNRSNLFPITSFTGLSCSRWFLMISIFNSL